MLAFAVAAGFDWFWEIAGLGAVFLLAAGAMVAARCAQLPAARHATARPSGRRFGLAVAGLALAWLAALALIGPLLVQHEIHASQAAASDGDLTTRRRPRRNGPLDRALGRLALRAARPARRGAGRIPDGRRNFSRNAIEREDHNWQWYYLRSRVEHEAGDEAAAQADLERAQQLNPLNRDACRKADLRMSAARRRRRPARRPAAPRHPREAGPPAARRRRRAARPRSTRRAARCCGACSRPATGWRWSRALCVATAATSSADVATLFWAILFSPVWILVFKLHGPLRQRSSADPPQHPRRAAGAGLGERPRRPRPRRPAGAEPRPGPCAASTAIVVGVGVLVGSFVAARRDPLRLAPRWPAPPPGSSSARRWPPTRSRGASPPIPRRGCDRSATSPPRPGRVPAPAACRGSGSIADISPDRARARIERVIVTEQEMSEPAAEQLIEECKAAGLGLTFLPQPLRPARPRDRAQPPGRAAGPRLPLLRPVALDAGDEAGASTSSSRRRC